MTNGKTASTAEKFARMLGRCAGFLYEHAEDMTADLDKMTAIDPPMKVIIELDSSGACFISMDRKYLVP